MRLAFVTALIVLFPGYTWSYSVFSGYGMGEIVWGNAIGRGRGSISVLNIPETMSLELSFSSDFISSREEKHRRSDFAFNLPCTRYFIPLPDEFGIDLGLRNFLNMDFNIKSPQDTIGEETYTQYINGKGGVNIASWEITKRIAEILKAKVVIFQTPKSFKECKENAENIRTFFSSLDRRFKYAWEARGWSDEGVKELCNELNLIHCVDPFANSTSTEGIAYFRLHGSQGKRMYRYRYTENDFEFLRDACRKFEEAYALFNNIYMWEDAVRFKEFVRTRAC